MGDNQDKGKLLEHIVEAIERFILQRNPGMQYFDIKIQSRKILSVAGVKHEIDLYVEIDMGSGYNAVFIFECRNRAENVTKNDIIIFSEKIKVFNAQRGFFVARSFAKDAQNQAKNDLRIELVIADELTEQFAYIKFTNSPTFTLKKMQMDCFEEGSKIRISVEEEPICTMNGESVNSDVLLDYLKGECLEYVQIKYDDPSLPPVKSLGLTHVIDYSTAQFRELPAGKHIFDDIVEVNCQDKNITVNGKIVSVIRVALNHEIEMVPPVLIWHYDVQNRGRVALFEYSTPEGVYRLQVTGIGDAIDNVVFIETNKV